ncbi:MAG: class I SAM-dependent methyltransferase [Planctomycetota bacterium]|jgi:SAM-dependent methyltransferase
MRVVIAPPYPKARRFAELESDHGGPHDYFARLLDADPRMRQCVLDIGCGADLPRVDRMREVLSGCTRLDGVDPDPGIQGHPHLTRRWCTTFEQSDVPDDSYDAIFTFWVLEHVADARAFLSRTCRVLRPGGVLYAFTPHAVHPFALMTRAVQAVGLRQPWRRSSRQKVNPYPAYYRLNRLGSIVRAARGLNFESAEFHYVPSLAWHNYFPPAVRFLPRLYDRLLTARYRRCANVLIFKLEKAGEAAAAGGPAGTGQEDSPGAVA